MNKINYVNYSLLRALFESPEQLVQSHMHEIYFIIASIIPAKTHRFTGDDDNEPTVYEQLLNVTSDMHADRMMEFKVGLLDFAMRPHVYSEPLFVSDYSRRIRSATVATMAVMMEWLSYYSDKTFDCISIRERISRLSVVLNVNPDTEILADSVFESMSVDQVYASHMESLTTSLIKISSLVH